MNNTTDNSIINCIKNNKVLTIITLTLFALSIIVNGSLGYIVAKKAKANRELNAIITNKSNCVVTPAPVETPAETPPATTTPTKKRSTTPTSTDTIDSGSTGSSSSSTQETVIPPPPPPSD